MKKRLVAAIVFLCTSLALVAEAHGQGGNNGSIGIVTVPLANVRQEPEPKSPIVTQVLLGDEVRVIEKQEYRYRISVPNQGDAGGWIHQEAVLVPKDKGNAYLFADRQRIVITAPKARALILDKLGNHNVSLYAGTRLPVVKTTTEGYTVQFPDRTLAVLDPSDAAPARPWNPVAGSVTPESIADTARKFNGVKHLGGGLTAQGIDTAGLVHIVYRVHGVFLGKTLGDIAKKAERVDKKELQPGDILVFHGEGLGLFLGGGRFLRSDGKRQVQVGGIYDKRFSNSLRYGLRIIGTDPALKKRPLEMTADEILVTQSFAAELPLGKRIAYWAGRFINTPYDPDPLGLYVRTNRIVADEKVDCMYHTFRSVELAMTSTPAEAIEKARDLRFIDQGKLVDGLVQNYDSRFQYGEDMVYSGKWGKNITAELGTTKRIPGSRGRDEVEVLPKETLMRKSLQRQLMDGDIIYWIKDPKKRVVEEIVAHLSTVRVKSGKPYLIHAAGSKDSAGKPGGGAVKEVPFSDYVRDMRFIGAFVTRFEK
jgi:cell wall-associated NlpC family hydrolase